MERRVLVEILLGISSVLQSTHHPGAVVVAATNRIDDLDPAVIRRFDTKVRFSLPDALSRERIIREELGRARWDTQLPESKPTPQTMSTLVGETEGYSGADIASLVRRASAGALYTALLNGREPQPPTEADVLKQLLSEKKN